MSQPELPRPLVLVPFGALERPLAVPEPAQRLSDVARAAAAAAASAVCVAVCVAELAVPRPRRRGEAALPGGDVFGGRDKVLFVVVVVGFVFWRVGVEGVESEKFFFPERGEMMKKKKTRRRSLALSFRFLSLSHPSSSSLLLLLLSSESLTEASLGFQEAAGAGSISSSESIFCF